MLRARNRGRLLQGEADYQLHVIYLWYERQTPRALQLLQSLHERYPANPLFVAQTAEIQDVYQHDVTASLATWQSLLAAAREQRANAPVLSEVQARLGIAKQLEVLQQTDDAIEMLQAVIALHPSAPYASLPLAYLRLGEAYDRIGARVSAVDAYRAAIASVPSSDPFRVRSQSNEHLRKAPDAKRADAYRLSLEGWRRLEHNDVAEAADALESSLALDPADPVAHYRYGRVQQARKDDHGALAQFEHAIRARTRVRRPFSATPTSKPRAYSNGSVVVRMRSPTTTSRRRCSAPPPTLGRQRHARSPDSSAKCASLDCGLPIGDCGFLECGLRMEIADCRLSGSATLHSSIVNRHSQSSIDTLNRQSTLSIVNRHSRSSIDDQKNRQSSISTPRSITTATIASCRQIWCAFF